MEIWTDTDTGDDLENDDTWPGGVCGKVDVESEPKRHEEHAKPDRREVLTCLPNKNTGDCGDQRKRESEREDIYAGKNGGRAEDCLEV